MLGLGNLLTKSGVIKKFPNDFSFNFDGNGDYLDCGASNVLVTGTNVTLSCWFKVDGTSRGYLIQNQKGAGSTNLTIQVNSNDSSETAGYVGAIIWSGAGHDFISVDGSVDDGAWHHLALTTTSSAQVLYLDGTSVATGSGTFTNASSTDSTLIGNDGSSNYDFDGLIDEVAVWSVALSADDVAKIASKPLNLSKASTYATDRTSNLKLWLRAGDKVLPESDTSIARSDFYTDFDGTDDYVEGSDVIPAFGTNPFSVSVWVNPTLTNQDGLFANSNGASGDYFFLSISATNFVGVGTSTAWKHKFTSSDTQRNTWQLLTYVREGTGTNQSKWYINGELKDTATDTTNWLTGTGWHIGSYSDSNGHFPGAISSLAIYKTALDAQTIKQFSKSRYTPMRDNRFSVVDFDGSDDHIVLSSSALYSTHTFSIWVNPTDNTGSGVNTILLFENDSNNFVQIWHTGTGNSNGKNHIMYRVKANGVLSDNQYATEEYADEWIHIVGVSSSSGTKLYINGVEKISNSTDVTNFQSGTVNEYFIGRDTNTLLGSISSVAVYNTAKSAEEVYAIYQQGITYDESSLSGLQGYWRMGDDTSKAYPTIADSSSNSNDGTMTSMASDDIVQQMISGYDMGAFESSSEELGEELISNSTFDDSTDWTTVGDFTISNGVASITNASQYSQLSAYSSNFLYSGKTYKLQLDVTTLSKTAFAYRVSGGAVTYITSSKLVDNTFTTYFTMTQNGYLWFQTTGSYTGLNVVIDNVSVKEVFQSDLSDTYPAIIDVNEPVLGAELFSAWTNGNTGFGAYPAYDSFSFSNKVLNIAGTGSTANMTVWEDVSLVANTVYKITYSVSGAIGGGNSSYFRFAFATKALETSLSVFNEQTGLQTDGDKIIYVQATSTATGYYGFRSANQPNLTISNFSIKAVSGNVGTMTQMLSSNLVYSSVLPDQSFLTGVNSAYNFIDLDGADQYIDCGDGTSLDTTSQLTLSSWVNFDSTGTNVILARDDNTNSNYILYGWSDGKIYAQIQISGVGKTVDGGSYSSDTWYHVVVTFDGSSLKIYVDADLKDTLSASGSIDNDDVSLEIGRKGNNAFHFDGQIGQTAIWNKSLSSTEVGAIYNLGRHGNLLDSYSDNLVGNWAMSSLDSATGLSDSISTVYDRSGNSNHGTPTNADAGDLASSPNAEPNGYAKGDTNRSTTTP